MKEIELLKSMWKSKTDTNKKIKRKTEYIVPEISYINEVGSLHNEHWVYKVPYAYTEALDIKYEQRMKDKKPYMIWTQGPVISFKDGDFLTKKDDKNALQVIYSQPMGWDTSKNEMYQGSITYDYFEINNGKHIKTKTNTCNQMQLLELLIYGKKHC